MVSVGKVIAGSALGFCLGAGMMMTQQGSKWRRSMMKQANMVHRRVKQMM